LEYKTNIFRENKQISPSLHNFDLDEIKHRGQTETSARILKTVLKNDEVYPEICRIQHYQGKIFKN